jgi:hypothetical protein
MLCSTDNLGEVVGEFRANVAAVAGFTGNGGEIWVMFKSPVRSGFELNRDRDRSRPSVAAAQLTAGVVF